MEGPRRADAASTAGRTSIVGRALTRLMHNFLDHVYNMNQYVVEFVGTLFFIYVILATGNAIAIGAALAVAIMAGGAISGGNFNPAVTIAMAAAGKLKSSEVAPYIIAQVAGGLVALELYQRVKR